MPAPVPSELDFSYIRLKLASQEIHAHLSPSTLLQRQVLTVSLRLASNFGSSSFDFLGTSVPDVYGGIRISL